MSESIRFKLSNYIFSVVLHGPRNEYSNFVVKHAIKYILQNNHIANLMLEFCYQNIHNKAMNTMLFSYVYRRQTRMIPKERSRSRTRSSLRFNASYKRIVAIELTSLVTSPTRFLFDEKSDNNHLICKRKHYYR